MLGTLPELIDACGRLRAAKTPFVLATIVSTDGSTYRKAGASMILCESGEFTGLLGGGSFERELLEIAAPVFANHRALLVNCDMPSASDAAPGRQWSRDGGARILLQYHCAENGYRPLQSIADCLAARRSAVLVSVCQSSDPAIAVGATVITGPGLPADLPVEILSEVEATAGAVQQTGNPMLVQHPVEDGEVEAFYCPIQPPLQVLLLGAGPDAVPVARFARQMGWEVTVADPREAYCRPERFPETGRVLHLQSTGIAALNEQSPFDCALLLTRNFETDREFLERLADTNVPFIGILGSKTRCARLLDTQRERKANLANRVHGPVGLPLDASTPEEIALSIVAEMQSFSRILLKQRLGVRTQEAGSVPAQSATALHAVILAAGGSRRYGGFKQLLEYRGESMLRRTTRLATEVLDDRVIVVHGPKAPKCQRELAGMDVMHAVNANWEGGIATSIRRGLQAVPEKSQAVLVLLCDQPLIELQHLQDLVTRWQAAPDRIVASAYGGGPGVPAIFPRRWFDRLEKLEGDRGARLLMEENSREVILVDFPDAAVDIDTQDDYQALILGQPNRMRNS